MPCDKDTFRLFSSLSLFVHIRTDVIETVYLSFFLQFYTNFRPDSRWSSWACLKFIDLMSVARRTFTFSSETETSRKDEEYETVEDGAGQGGMDKVTIIQKLSLSFLVRRHYHMNLELNNWSSLKREKYHIEFTSFSFSDMVHVLQEFSCRSAPLLTALPFICCRRSIWSDFRASNILICIKILSRETSISRASCRFSHNLTNSQQQHQLWCWIFFSFFYAFYAFSCWDEICLRFQFRRSLAKLLSMIVIGMDNFSSSQSQLSSKLLNCKNCTKPKLFTRFVFNWEKGVEMSFFLFPLFVNCIKIWNE